MNVGNENSEEEIWYVVLNIIRHERDHENFQKYNILW